MFLHLHLLIYKSKGAAGKNASLVFTKAGWQRRGERRKKPSTRGRGGVGGRSKKLGHGGDGHGDEAGRGELAGAG